MTIERVGERVARFRDEIDDIKYFLVGAFSYVFVASLYAPIKIEIDKNKIGESLKDVLIIVAAGAVAWLLATRLPISGLDPIYAAILAGAAIALVRFGNQKNKN